MSVWENPVIETSEWNTFLSLINQGQPDCTSTLVSHSEIPIENIVVPFPDLAGLEHHEASSPIFGESFYQDCPLDTLESMFQLDTFERNSRAQEKLPMSDPYTPFEFPIDEMHQELQIKSIDSIAEDSPEFEELVRDSWVYICNYDKEQNELFRENLTEGMILKETTPEILPLVKPEKRYKSLNKLSVVPEEIDISKLPNPICSCTGAPRICYRWGDGGWTSSCCTIKLSQCPLPLQLISGRKQRKVGRKMSSSTFKIVVEKLYATGYNFRIPIDLKTYWAKPGTNQFVIK